VKKVMQLFGFLCSVLLLLLLSAVAAGRVDEWRARHHAAKADAVEDSGGALAYVWDGQGIRLPTPGWLYQDRRNVTLRLNVSHVPAEAFRADWRWELWLNGNKAGDLEFTPAAPAVTVVVTGGDEGWPAGRHEVQVRLHGVHGMHAGELVPFFVDREGSPFSMVESAAREHVAEKREGLMNWVQEHGQGFTKLRIDGDKFGGNALFASQDIAEDEVVGHTF
jgi:hypothetical protein